MPDPTEPALTPAPAARPGVKTSEFALNLLAITLSALFVTDVIPTSGPIAKLAAVAAIVLTSLGYTVSRTLVKRTGALVLVLLLGSPHVMACGGVAAARAKSVSVALVSVDAADAAYLAFEVAAQDAIVAKATSLAEGEKELLAWRAKQATARGLFANAYRAISMAKLVNDDATAMSVMRALKLLRDHLVTMGVKL